jgi:hypothetical protein
MKLYFPLTSGFLEPVDLGIIQSRTQSVLIVLRFARARSTVEIRSTAKEFCILIY